MGVENAAVWNNIGLCAYFSQEYETCFLAYKKAIEVAFGDDNQSSQIWYNLGQVASSMGDLSFAYQCYKIAIAVNNRLAEAWNNLGVSRKDRQISFLIKTTLQVIEQHTQANKDIAKSHFLSAIQICPFLYEPLYNAGKYGRSFLLGIQVAYLSHSTFLLSFG
jgi:tetratricopeptide repeat protein 8